MNLIETEKDKFSPKWWDLLKSHFNKPYMQQIYLKIMFDADKGYKILPKSDVIYNRFKLINPDDVRVVFLTEQPICMYEQSKEWQLMSRWIENECFDGLHLNIENNLDYLIPFGIINLSSSLTVCNKSDHSNIGWFTFTTDIIHILNNTGNKVLFVSNEITGDNVIKLEEGCFIKINQFMKTEYNTKINWDGK